MIENLSKKEAPVNRKSKRQLILSMLNETRSAYAFDKTTRVDVLKINIENDTHVFGSNIHGDIGFVMSIFCHFQFTFCVSGFF